jgi:hypothetical protein
MLPAHFLLEEDIGYPLGGEFLTGSGRVLALDEWKP